MGHFDVYGLVFYSLDESLLPLDCTILRLGPRVKVYTHDLVVAGGVKQQLTRGPATPQNGLSFESWNAATSAGSAGAFCQEFMSDHGAPARNSALASTPGFDCPCQHSVSFAGIMAMRRALDMILDLQSAN